MTFDGRGACRSPFVRATADDARRPGAEISLSVGGGALKFATACIGIETDVSLKAFVNFTVSASCDDYAGFAVATSEVADSGNGGAITGHVDARVKRGRLGDGCSTCH